MGDAVLGRCMFLGCQAQATGYSQPDAEGKRYHACDAHRGLDWHAHGAAQFSGLAGDAPKSIDDVTRIIHGLGLATGGLCNAKFRDYLSERGISDAEMDDVRDRLAKLGRAFYVER